MPYEDSFIVVGGRDDVNDFDLVIDFWLDLFSLSQIDKTLCDTDHHLPVRPCRGRLDPPQRDTPGQCTPWGER